MLLNEFKLEIVVNGKPLKEYPLPKHSMSTSTTERSYALDEITRQKVYSDAAICVTIQNPTFLIQISSITAPLMAIISIDGDNKTYKEISNSASREVDCSLREKPCSEVGVISAHFYKSIKSTMDTMDNEPIAVLNLHYHPTCWLSFKKCDVPEIGQPNQENIEDIKEEEPQSSGKYLTYTDLIELSDSEEENFSEIFCIETDDGDNVSDNEDTSKVDLIELSDSEEDEIITKEIIELSDSEEVEEESESDDYNDNDEVINVENLTQKNNKRTYANLVELSDSEEENPSKIICID